MHLLDTVNSCMRASFKHLGMTSVPFSLVLCVSFPNQIPFHTWREAASDSKSSSLKMAKIAGRWSSMAKAVPFDMWRTHVHQIRDQVLILSC